MFRADKKTGQIVMILLDEIKTFEELPVPKNPELLEKMAGVEFAPYTTLQRVSGGMPFFYTPYQTLIAKSRGLKGENEARIAAMLLVNLEIATKREYRVKTRR